LGIGGNAQVSANPFAQPQSQVGNVPNPFTPVNAGPSNPFLIPSGNNPY